MVIQNYNAIVTVDEFAICDFYIGGRRMIQVYGVPLINSQNGVREILISLFGLSEDNIKNEFILNKEKLWELKESHPIMKNWSNFNYSYFVWYAWKKHANKTNSLPIDKLSDVNQREINLWVVRAGGKGEDERTALDNNIITIGWNNLSDLSSIKDKKSLRELYLKLHPQQKENSASAQVGQVWRFIHDLKKGDLVILPRLYENSHEVAVGRVTEDYDFREISPSVKHARGVEWLKKDVQLSDGGGTKVNTLPSPSYICHYKNVTLKQ